MVLSKRERVLRTVTLEGEPDVVPIFTLGFERTSKTFLDYQNSDDRKNCLSWVQSKATKLKYYKRLRRERFMLNLSKAKVTINFSVKSVI